MTSILPLAEKAISEERSLQRVLGVFLRTKEDRIENSRFVSFQGYYERIWAQLPRGLFPEAEDIGVVSNDHICGVVETAIGLLQPGSMCHRALLHASIAKLPLFRDHSCDSIDRIIDLALRLWLAVYIRDNKYSSLSSLQWDDGSELRQFLGLQFEKPRWEEDCADRVDKMTMVKLRRYSGIRVEWSDDLREHLELNLKRRTVKVFRLKYYMYRLSQSDVEVIPTQVIQDYLTTMNLLFPSYDDDTLQYLEETGQKQLRFEGPTSQGPVHLADLLYWRDRLSALWIEFQAPAPSMRQLFYDTRNPLQWYTFWFAVAILILTVVFGIISSVLTGLQTGYSRESLLLARAAAASPPVCPPMNCVIAPS